ncbi:LexA family protein [Streptomyces violens]|uniref:LexA family protein n=1 Tax=Streptomyces violens TaxID=66377 RepID=UPI001FE15F11|nr:helix-turn-helix domain-containing protein [Streptomyces violens]
MSERQERVLACVREWIAEHGEAPTVREVGQQVGLSSPSSVHYQLRQLEHRGILRRTERRWRAYQLR